nr:reverse transcriptase domain-containing protein [Tanacetum cinerariifolium]
LTSKSKQLLLTVKLLVVLIPTMIVRPPLAKLRTYMLREPIKVIRSELPEPEQESRKHSSSGKQPREKPILPGSWSWSKPTSSLSSPGLPSSGSSTSDSSAIMKMNTASSSGSGTLPGNTITNPKEDLKGITTRSGNAYQGPTIPTTSSSLPKVVERETEPVVAPIIEPVVAPVSALKPNQKLSIPYPSRLYDRKLRDKANDQKEKFFQIFQDWNFNISFADALILMPKYALILMPKFLEKLRDPGKFLIPCNFPGMGRCLALADLGASINLMPLPVWNKLSFPKLSPTCMTLKLADRLISHSVRVAEDVFVKVGTFHFLAGFVVVDFDADPQVSLILRRSFLKTERVLIDVFEGELTLPKTDKSLIDEPPKVELKDLPPHLEYTVLEGDDKLPVIIAKDLSDEEKTALITVLKSHKRAIAWKLSEFKGINPEFCTHKILMEEDFKPAVQHQRRVNPKIYDVIKKEVEKLLDAGLIYPISNNPWVRPVNRVPKNGGFTVVENEESVVLRQRQEKHFRPIHYASKTMTEAELTYTTIEKEILVVVVSSILVGILSLSHSSPSYLRTAISNYGVSLDNAMYSASADGIAVQFYFFDIQLTYLSPRNCIPPGSTLQDKQPSMNIQPTLAPSTHKYVHAKENNDNQSEEGEHLPDDEFTNPFYAPA